MRSRRGPGAAALALALALSAAGCSEDGREFAVPKKVCGTTIEQSALSPLLPPDGKKLKEDDRTLVTSDTGCTVEVDGRDAVTFGRTGLNERVDPVTTLKEDLLKHVTPLRGLPVPGRGAFADRGAVVAAECGTKGAKYLLLEFRFGDLDHQYPEDVKDRRKAIQRFVKDVTPNAVKEKHCTT
ncbi:hypothetical protein [Streptomyces sp. 3N207]|uniref:hypothetical protein n=1 Tax=Streptomyces sp. 3N207 TaxID=3457417 RepID=UPI003FD45BBF